MPAGLSSTTCSNTPGRTSAGYLRARLLLAVSLMVAILGTLVPGAGCKCGSTPAPHWGVYSEPRELRLRALNGEDVEAEAAEALQYLREADQRRIVVEALGYTGTDRVLPLLRTLIEHPDTNGDTRAAAEVAIERIEQRAASDDASQVTPEQREAFYDELEAIASDPDADTMDRLIALNELFYFDPFTAERVAAVIREWFGRPDHPKEYRDSVASLCLQLTSPVAIDAICGMAGDPAWFFERVTRFHAEIRDRFRGRYREILRDNLESEQTAIGAALLLGQEGDPAIIPVLEPFLDSTDEELQKLALLGMQRVVDSRVAELANRTLASSTDRAILEAALTAQQTNFDQSRDLPVIGEYIGRWPESIRLKALETLGLAGAGGPQDLYYQLMQSDPSAEVRRAAILMRFRPAGESAGIYANLLPGEPNEERDLAVVVAVLGADTNVGVATSAAEKLDWLYGSSWADNAAATAAAIRAARRFRNERETSLRPLFSAIGTWGRYEDAPAVEALVPVDELTYLHGTYASNADRDSRRAAMIPADVNTEIAEVPAFAAVREILERHTEEYERDLVGFAASLPAARRGFLLHYAWLLEGSLALEAWTTAIEQGGPNAIANDLRYFQPFALTPPDPNWGAMFGLLGQPLGAASDSVAGAAFRVLDGRFYVQQEAGSGRAGLTLNEVFALGGDGEFTTVLIPAFRTIIESGSGDRLDFVADLVGEGILPPDEVAALAEPLFTDRGDLSARVARVFLEQLSRDLTAESFDGPVAAVINAALNREDREIRLAAARVIDQNFRNSDTVNMRLLNRLLDDADDEIQAVGARALMQMATWIVEDPDSDRSTTLRELMRPLLADLGASEDREVIRAVTGTFGALAPYVEPRDSDDYFVEQVAYIAIQLADKGPVRADAQSMRPLSRLLAAVGDEDTYRAVLLNLLQHGDGQVRANALSGLAKQVSFPGLLEPMQAYLANESFEAARQQALGVYRGAAIAEDALDPAIWLVRRYDRYQAETDRGYAEAILANWINANRRRRSAVRTRLVEEAVDSAKTWSLILPALPSYADASMLDLMAEVLASDDAADRLLAPPVLVRIPGSRADRLMAELINDEAEPVRMAAIEAARTSGRISSLVALMDRQAAEGVGQQERRAIGTALSEILTRIEATMPPGEQLAELRRLLAAAASDEQRVMLLNRIAATRDADGHLEAVIEALESEHAALQIAAAEAIPRIWTGDNTAAIGVLETLVDDEDDEVRMAMVEAISRLENIGDGASALLLAVLTNDESFQVRIAALHALTSEDVSARVSGNAIRRILEGNEANAGVRLAAVEILSDRMADGKDVGLDMLLVSADDDDDRVRLAAVEGIRDFIESDDRDSFDSRGLRDLTPRLLRDENPRIRQAAVPLAVYCAQLDATGEFIELLREAANDSDRAVARAARESLAELQ